jgi:hypothetical protein
MMKFNYQIAGLFALLTILYVSPGFAQDENTETATDPDASTGEANEVAADQEVEINEDNYRQFMELNDPRQQRNVIPETAYKSQAQMQKLDKLPEESQKHLRNQLREIITQGDPWKPGDENNEYPYTASEAADQNPSLQEQETEAWGELVQNYHQREAEIYGNSARSSAAAAAAAGNPGDGGQGSGPGNNAGSTGNDANQGEDGQQSSQEKSSGQQGSSGSYSPNSSADQAVKSTDGVSQNAMEFLKSHSGTNAGEKSSPGSANQNKQGASQEDSEGETQNALEFLKTDASASARSSSSQTNPERTQSEQKAEVIQEDAQNALKYLTGDTAVPTESGIDEDTISIEDLLNAQGVSDTSQTPPPASDDDNETKPDEIPIEKDGGGQ